MVRGAELLKYGLNTRVLAQDQVLRLGCTQRVSKRVSQMSQIIEGYVFPEERIVRMQRDLQSPGEFYCFGGRWSMLERFLDETLQSFDRNTRGCFLFFLDDFFP